MAKDKKSGFKYRGRDRTVEGVSRRSRQAGGAYDSYLQASLTMYKVKEGENCVRILPPTWEDTDKWGDSWEIGIQIHYDVGPDKGVYLCSDKMLGDPCPVCDARRDAVDDDEADALRPSWRALCWVIDRDSEKAGPQIWSMPITLFREINLRSIDKKTNTPILVDDPEEGFDIVFSREGTGLRTKYTAVEIERDPSPLHEDESIQNRWLDYVSDNAISEVMQFYPPEHIEKVLFGKSSKRRTDDDSDEEEEEEAPRRSRRSTPVQEEEPDTEDEDGEEEEKEETPRRSRVTRRRRVSNDDDKSEDEDEDSDDGDEDEDEDEDASTSAREQLGRLSRKRGRK